jgi:hypothetical protein
LTADEEEVAFWASISARVSAYTAEAAFPPELAAPRRLAHSIERVLAEDSAHTLNKLKGISPFSFLNFSILSISSNLRALIYFWIPRSQFCPFEVAGLFEASPNKQTMSNI